MATTTVKTRKLSWMDTLRSLTKPKVGVMALLGFASGLPFMLVGNTLGFWLRESGITLATIGFLSWVGLAYSFKFLWAPFIDKVDAPILGRMFGRRRGWLMLSQLVVGGALIAMAIVKPEGGIMTFTALAALAAFASSTQDIVVDAWRIEVSDNSEEMAMLSSAYQLGYRVALLLTDSVILIVASSVGWSMSYIMMGVTMSLGILGTFLAVEPKRAAEAAKQAVVKEAFKFGAVGKRIFDAIAGPFIVFFKTYGVHAALILAAISLYRLPDFVMGPMAAPFYTDLGIAKEVVGAVRGTAGLIASIVGVALGGICAVRFGFRWTLLIGAILGPASNLGFSLLAVNGGSHELFTAVMIVDNVSTGFAGTALVGYMSSLTSIGYTATQYALLSSFYTLLGKTLKGLSGQTVEWLQQSHSLMDSYALFFLGTALVGIPAFLLCMLLVKNNTKRT